MTDLWQGLDDTLWLPTSVKEAEKRGWNQVDVVLFSGDAYVDHPSFGAAVIARILEREGLRVAVVPQPNWQDDLRDFRKFGTPARFFAVTAGNMDSMVNHYTANKRLRHDDAYTPGNKYGARPDYAVTVYSAILRKLYPDVPIVIGGIEASLRRLTHYDYWQDQLKPSVLMESQADLLIYGMGERPVESLVRAFVSPADPLARAIPQTAWKTRDHAEAQSLAGPDAIWLHSFEECCRDKVRFAENFRKIETESNRLEAKTLVEKSGDWWVVVNPPYPPPDSSELDRTWELPFTRLPHPRYRKKEPIPAFSMIRNSITIHRGCFGGCSFCTISAHQGKFISSRSEPSVLKEVEQVKNSPGFSGHISDLGGPSANMYRMAGLNQDTCRKCARPSCIFPRVCPNLDTSHESLTQLYEKVRNTKGIKKLTIGSGIRYDLLLSDQPGRTDPDKLRYLRNLIRHHVSGRLKVAPEHSDSEVLRLMRKPPFSLFKKLWDSFHQIQREEKLNLQLIPYYISSHPGCRDEAMAELAGEMADTGYQPEQVQDFTPTPLTLSSVMFYTGLDPYTGKPVFVPRTREQKLGQRLFFFWYQKEYRDQIRQALRKLNRPDLEMKLLGGSVSGKSAKKDLKGIKPDGIPKDKKIGPRR